MAKKTLSNEEVLDILESSERQVSPRLLKEDAPLDERLKHALCRLFVMYINKKGIRSTDLKDLLGIPKTRLSDLENYKTKSYSLDRLLRYAEKLASIDPQTREHLHLMMTVVAGPVRTVSNARKISQELKKTA